jgi:hypothetical protein
VQLATRAKRKINEMVKEFPIDMNALSTREDFKIIPLGSYDWLDCYNKAFTYLDEEENLRIVQGIPK